MSNKNCPNCHTSGCIYVNIDHGKTNLYSKCRRHWHFCIKSQQNEMGRFETCVNCNSVSKYQKLPGFPDLLEFGSTMSDYTKALTNYTQALEKTNSVLTTTAWILTASFISGAICCVQGI